MSHFLFLFGIAFLVIGAALCLIVGIMACIISLIEFIEHLIKTHITNQRLRSLFLAIFPIVVLIFIISLITAIILSL